jgi:hypothetical protein
MTTDDTSQVENILFDELSNNNQLTVTDKKRKEKYHMNKEYTAC